ncbi:MAG: flagellar hook-basal body protein [bacterium]|nr:flagellar hook-basal body protein [bacterium]
MKNGIYSVTSGMLTSMERLNSTSNNLANFSTNGYKSDVPFEQTIRFLAEGPFPGKDQPVLGGHNINMQTGVISITDRKLDMAFQGDGFFTLQGPNNKELYTRNGAFTLNSQRELMSQDGMPVLDRAGNKITVYGDKFEFTPKGDVFIDNTYFTSLKIVKLDKTNVEKIGQNFFKLKDESKPVEIMTNPDLALGALEKSNVNMLDGITNLIKVQRAFDLQKTAADTLMKALRKSITDVAKPV